MSSDPLASCSIHWDGQELVAGNALIERRWRLIGASLAATSLRDRIRGDEWLTGEVRPGTVPACGQIGPAGAARLHVAPTQLLPASMPALGGTLTVPTVFGDLVYQVTVWSECPAIGMQVHAPAALAARGEVRAAGPSRRRAGGVERGEPAWCTDDDADLLECLILAPHHGLLHQVELADRTDVTDNLMRVHTHRLSTVEEQRLRGVVFALEDPLTRAGLILVKHSALPGSRPQPCETDCVGRFRELRLLGHQSGVDGLGDAWSVLVYAGGELGRRRALHRLQRAWRPYRRGRDGLLISNTWGDRNRDGRIATTFLRREIRAGARLGVEVIQIDDGWQKGVTVNSVKGGRGGRWEGYWERDADFWTPHPRRLRQGLEPLTTQAAESGVELGLWFSPDSSDDFSSWQRDLGCLMDLHRQHGVRHFKLDGIKLRSRAGELRLRALLDGLQQESQGRIVCDLDVTAEDRPGYFGTLGTGTLFLENRYTDWHRYWPHATLRNLWDLAQVIDPLRLRIEFLNPERNRDRYAGDPLAPVCYPPDYLAAIACCASPLAWCEVSELPPSVFRPVARFLRGWKTVRDAFFSGLIEPIGDRPDGGGWTGFCSVSPLGDEAVACVFRELHPDADRVLALPMALPDDRYRVRRVAGSGKATLVPGGLRVHQEEPLRYCLVRLERLRDS